MKFRIPILLLTMALPLAPLGAKEQKPAASPTPKTLTSLQKWLRSVGFSKDRSGTSKTGFMGLNIGLALEPAKVVLPETKQLKVIIRLINNGNKMVQLNFPSSQRIEVLVKSKAGKTIEQWSEDQAFTDEPSMVTINPDERVEYAVNVSTRDMVVGETYSIEAFFPNFDALRKSTTVEAITPPPKSSPSPSPGASPTPTIVNFGHRKSAQ
jgi:hypothetical protein